MFIKQVHLHNFRNYTTLSLSLHPSITIFYGNNAQGKTNILESIYICALGRSHRTHSDKELIRFSQEEAHIQLQMNKKNREERIDIHIKKDIKKGAAINGIPVKKLGELLGTLHVVMFSPEDLQLIKGGPAERRRFLDMEICQLSSIYFYDLQQYYKVLRQRNNLLKEIQKKPQVRDTLFVWDEQLIQYGRKVVQAREIFIQKLNTISATIHTHITGEREVFQIQYKPYISAQLFEQKLQKSLERDLLQGSTSVGPHRDDISFCINHVDVRTYGSQGQQRTAALSIKLAEIELIKEEIGEAPVLLLDDVLSELDESRQNYLLSHIQGIQTLLTCTGIEDLVNKQVAKGFLYRVNNGIVENTV